MRSPSPGPKASAAAAGARWLGGGLRPPAYTPRHAAYDLRKLRGKALVGRVGTTRRYQPQPPGVRTLAALPILREQVVKPVLAGAGKPKPGRPPKRPHPLDVHYENLQRALRRTLDTLGLAA